MKVKAVFYKDSSNQWRWRILAENGRIVGDSSEGYHNRVDAENGFELIVEAVKNGSIDIVVDRPQPK